MDTSVLLAACASRVGASREIFRLASRNQWMLVATPYILAEVLHNLPEMPETAAHDWALLSRELLIMDDVLTLDRPSVFPVAKDRPILFGAVAWADVLLTLDRKDFGSLLNTEFYGLPVFTPGIFIACERRSGRLKE